MFCSNRVKGHEQIDPVTYNAPAVCMHGSDEDGILAVRSAFLAIATLLLLIAADIWTVVVDTGVNAINCRHEPATYRLLTSFYIPSPRRRNNHSRRYPRGARIWLISAGRRLAILHYEIHGRVGNATLRGK